MKKTKIPTPLTTGAVIARRTVTLGLGHVAEITISYDGPNEPAPNTGQQWPPEKDWPAAELRLVFPRQQEIGYAYLPGDLQCEAVVKGERMHSTWGQAQTMTIDDKTVTIGRFVERRRSGESLRKLAADLLRETLVDLRPVQQHLDARAKRLAQREATLHAGLDIAPLKNQ